MKAFPLNRVVWIIGVVLLVGTVAGAGYFLNRPSDESTNDAPFEGASISAIGYADVEPGVARLVPERPGKVVWIESESKEVNAGDPILRIDDRQAKAKLTQVEALLRQAENTEAEAKIALDISNIALEKAKVYPEQHAARIKQQKAYLEAADKEKSTGQDKLKDAIKFFNQKSLSQADLNTAKDFFKRVAAVAEAEKQKLKILEFEDPQWIVKKAKLDVELKSKQLNAAKLNVAAKKTLVDEANLVITQHVITAPTKGFVLRAHVQVGETLGTSTKLPAIEFCPAKEKIIRTEVLQEWAANIKVGDECMIRDDTAYGGHEWKGKVVRISKWYTQRRSVIQEPFQFNDVRTLECIVSVKESPEHPLRIGQRMRVAINQGGP